MKLFLDKFSPINNLRDPIECRISLWNLLLERSIRVKETKISTSAISLPLLFISQCWTLLSGTSCTLLLALASLVSSLRSGLLVNHH